MRKAWIDILRGIGIVLVVIGHNTTSENLYDINIFIYSFHMPLFFLLSGFLFTPKLLGKYFHKSTKRLMLPYVTFLFVLAIPDFARWIAHFPQIDSDGGMALFNKILEDAIWYKNWYTTFWFIAVLWIASNLFNLIIRWQNRYCGLSLSIMIAYLTTTIPTPLPLRLRVVPMAITYIWIGFILSRNFEDVVTHKYFKHRWRGGVALCLICAVFVLMFWPNIKMDMKHADFGIPMLSICYSIAVFLILALFSKKLSIYNCISKPLCLIGEASMVIMILHLPVRDILCPKLSLNSTSSAIILGIFVPLVIYVLLNSTKIGRKYFIGK